jgi:F0F1-type ATP synthase membrane subunit b/b'
MNAWKTIGVAVALVVAVGWTCSALAQGPGETVQREGPTLQAEAAHEQAEAAGPNPLVFDPDLAVYSAIVFLLLLWVLGKYAWPPISAALDARERKIADNIESAAAKHEEAKRLLEEHETRLAAAAGEVRDLLAIDLARKVVRQEITADRQSQLVRDALGKLAAAKPSEN